MRTTILFLSLLVPAMGFAQPFSISSYRISGGGGSSSGGQFSVSGTLGQPDAGGALTGGNYSVASGFWSFLAVAQTPGAPRLSLQLTSTNTVALSWAAPSTGFVLEQNLDLQTANWLNVTNAVTTVGNQNQVIVLPPAGNRFYRLFHP